MSLKWVAKTGLFIPLIAALSACTDLRSIPKTIPQTSISKTCEQPSIPLSDDESLISIVATNDLHGAIQPKQIQFDQGSSHNVGGMAFWSGTVKAIRDGVTKRYGSRGGTLLLDGGDQFQGTLLSNYSEGELMFSLMNEAGYDAAVPGNHDYDFGPAGWLEDQVSERSSDKNPRGVIQSLAGKAKFALLSANTYLKSSLQTVDGRTVPIDSVRCATNEIIDWTKAWRPGFLRPFTFKEVAGVRIAIIGLDNPETSRSTTFANVSDLCFRSPLEEYKSIRESLDGQADLFVAVIHDGDINQEFNLTKLLTGILEWRKDGVDAIVGGHTHSVNLVQKEGVYGIQSGANGERFGRIDLVFDRKTKKVTREKTRANAGVMLFRESCDRNANPFCEVLPNKKVAFECESVEESPAALSKIADAEKVIAPLTQRVLGYSDKPIKKDREAESPLVNLLTDTLRAGTGAEISLINAGGVRTDLPAGPILYENLFQVSPFNNRAVILSPMKVSTLVKLITRSAQSCGKFSALFASGIRTVFHKGICVPNENGLDPNARLITIGLDDGTLLYDARDPDHPIINERDLRVVTLDFLATGGGGYDMFKEAPVTADLGIFREIVADQLAKSPSKISAKVDGRWVDEVAPITRK